MEQMATHTETRKTQPESHTAQRAVSIVFGIIEIILAFRLVFKLLGANPGNGFVKGLYAITQPIVGIFEGIFSKATTAGAETTAVFEPATLILMVIIGLIAWAVMKMMVPRINTSEVKTDYTENSNLKK